MSTALAGVAGAKHRRATDSRRAADPADGGYTRGRLRVPLRRRGWARLQGRPGGRRRPPGTSHP